MNKKFLCGILACVMAFGTVFPIAACKPEGENNQGNNQGENNQGGNNQGSGENNNQSGGEIKPGTVITDQNLKTELYGSLSTTQIGGFTYSASANLSVSGEAGSQAQKIIAEGAVVVKDGEVQADICAYVTGSDGQEEVSQYMLLFVRNKTVYMASGDWHGEGEVDFSALKAQLKDTKEPLVLAKEELDGALEELLETPALVKMVKNLPSLFDGVVTKTEGGYSLVFDAMGAVNSLFDGLISVAAAVDQDHTMTLGNLFGHPFFKTTLEKLLYGITATELKDTLDAFLPEEVSDVLPEPAENATAISYAEGLLRSGSFYKALTQEGEEWSEWKTFAEVPLEGLISLLSGSEFTFGESKLAETLKEFKENLTSQAVSLLTGMIGLDEGELSGENIDLSLGFDFDEDKKLLGFSVDALVAGSRTLPPEEENEGENPEGEGQAPDDDEEQDSDEERVPGEDERTEETAKAKATEPEGTKLDVKGSVKLEAASASAPELYDLSGCKYYTEEGGTATITAKK